MALAGPCRQRKTLKTYSRGVSTLHHVIGTATPLADGVPLLKGFVARCRATDRPGRSAKIETFRQSLLIPIDRHTDDYTIGTCASAASRAAGRTSSEDGAPAQTVHDNLDE